MLETRIDTIEAYQPITGIGYEPIVINAEDLQSAIEKNPLGPKRVAEIVEIEERFFEVSSTKDPSVFAKKHRDFLYDSNAELHKSIHGILIRVVDNFSAYFADGDEIAEEQFRTLFNSRLDNITAAKVTDPLFDPNMGQFREMSRVIQISGLAYMQMHAGVIDKKDVLEDTLIAHEIIHGMLTSARTKDLFQNDFFTLDGMTRNGQSTRHTADDNPIESIKDLLIMHSWLMEGNIEDMRQRIMGTETTGYKFSVTILRTLKDLDPGLQELLEASAFGEQGPSELIGRLELLVGPTGVEEIDEASENNAINKDPVAGKKYIQSLLPENLRDQAGEAFDRNWNSNKGLAHLLDLAT